MKWVIGCALAGLLAAGLVSAQTVTLDMENVTLGEVVEELKAQSGYDLRIINRGGMGGLLEPRIEHVQATDRPLKEVLRQVCVWTDCRYRRVYGNQFYIEPGVFEQSQAATMIAGYRISVESVSINEGGRSLNLVKEYEGPRLQAPTLGLTLALEAPTDEAAAAVAGFEGMRVVDDEGLEGKMDESYEKSALQDNFQFYHLPDTTNVSLNFENVGLHAKKLKTLEGTLLLYEDVEELVFRFDDLSARNVTVRQGDVALTLEDVEVQPGQVRVVKKAEAPSVQVRGRDPRWAGGTLEVVFADGSVESAPSPFYPGSSGSHSMGLRRRDEEPVAIVCRVTRRQGPLRKLPFKIADIPLPN